MRLRAVILTAHLLMGGGSPSLHPTDGQSVSTAHWSCIRQHESTNGKLSSNIYQFQGSLFRSITGLSGPPGSYSRAVQDSAALSAYGYSLRTWGNGFLPWRADWKVCGIR